MIYNRLSHILWTTGEEMMRNSQGHGEILIKQTDTLKSYKISWQSRSERG